MSEAFAHLHVASGYSLRYGASTPATLVERAAALGQPALALTDRDGLYGAIRFVQACDEAGIAPVLGVDLAVTSPPPPGSLRAPGSSGSGSSGSPGRSGAPGRAQAPGRPPTASRPRGRTHPVRGGVDVDPRHPRVTVLARGQAGGAAPGAGWGRLCRLVTSTHLSGERGAAVSSAALLAEHATDPRTGDLALTVLLGPGSEVGRALLERRPDLARALLQAWLEVLPRGARHRGGPPRRPEGSPASLGHAARLLGLAAEAGLPAVLTNAVRYAEPGDAATVDVLDAARRLVPLDPRHLDRVTTAGHLSSTERMRRWPVRSPGRPEPG